ncbi:MAG: TetR/AcrR family transcriptional regulator [Actinomycetota bacterium]
MSKNPYHHGDLPRALRMATAELITERGPQGFSLREVARRAGVSHAAPGHHFGSALGLLSAVATEGFELFAAVLEEAAEASTDPLERLRVIARAYVGLALEHPGHYAVMFNAQAHSPDDEALAVAGHRAHEHLVDALTSVRDELNPELDAETAATATWSAMAGLVAIAPLLAELAADRGTEPRPLVELTDDICDLLVFGLVGNQLRV